MQNIYVCCGYKSTYRNWPRKMCFSVCVCDSASNMILLSHVIYAGSAPCSQRGTMEPGPGPVAG